MGTTRGRRRAAGRNGAPCHRPRTLHRAPGPADPTRNTVLAAVVPPAAVTGCASTDSARTGARTIFFEATAGDRVARTLAADLGLATDVLHPVERVQAEETCPELMAANLAALRRGLGCDG